MDATQENLKRLVHYNPDTGVMRRIGRVSWTGDNVYPCDFVPKSKTAFGYLQIQIFGRPHVVHRLAFLYMTGKFPEQDVDHINGDRADNRWMNLREVSRLENHRNKGILKSNGTGVVGVSKRSDTGSYAAYITVKNERKYLGSFKSFDEAVTARRQAEEEIGFHENHGRRPAWVQ